MASGQSACGIFFAERESIADEVRKSPPRCDGRGRHVRGMQVLRATKIGRDTNFFIQPAVDFRKLARDDCAILQACGLAANTIVAGGQQACDRMNALRSAPRARIHHH